MICGGNAGERRSLTICAQGTPFPLRKTKDMEERRTPEQDKNGGNAIPGYRDKTSQNKPSSSPSFPLTTILCNLYYTTICERPTSSLAAVER